MLEKAGEGIEKLPKYRKSVIKRKIFWFSKLFVWAYLTILCYVSFWEHPIGV